jgi:hypothetical protein
VPWSFSDQRDRMSEGMARRFFASIVCSYWPVKSTGGQREIVVVPVRNSRFSGGNVRNWRWLKKEGAAEGPASCIDTIQHFLPLCPTFLLVHTFSTAMPLFPGDSAGRRADTCAGNSRISSIRGCPCARGHVRRLFGGAADRDHYHHGIASVQPPFRERLGSLRRPG